MKMSGKLRTEAGADETSILTVVFLGDIAHQLFYNCSRTVSYTAKVRREKNGWKFRNSFFCKTVQIHSTIFIGLNLDSCFCTAKVRREKT